MMLISMICFVFGTLKASKNLHEPVLVNILKSPMSFFDTTPLGRILNRLSKDIEIIDMRFPFVLKMFINCVTQVFFVLIVNTFTNPVFFIIVVPLALIYIYALVSFIFIYDISNNYILAEILHSNIKTITST